MNKLNITLHSITLLAIATLFYFQFSSVKQGATDLQDSTVNTPVINFSPGGIVYVNSDSLLEQYEYFKKQKSDFENRQSRIRNELKSESDKLQRDVELYHQQAIGMTDFQKQQKEEEFVMRQQKLMDRKDQLLDQLDEEQARSSEELFTRLNNYLNKYNQDKNYQFILGYQKGGGILYANDSLDITKTVVEGLNKEYKAEIGSK
ncbi:MAG: OmpH family outer membrane protein [Bacteroidetes bacterium]|nr:MAG: OmpH family outer membrane protein [Bacteroidota bacterium]REK07625.1 MAG: OmpH family outer membrane protein [Bacteroidota bacterium]REK31789.1 MAG: OmpH family outer membrane protein [Bacteroidota bacterium]REK50146.1 MAG: OmpH family outer membrane protein [Bacteroidota bacterium]